MRGSRTATPTEGIEWTPRQREVLDLLAAGKTNAEIGEQLGISFDGAKWHVAEILSKLGVPSREQAAEYWRHERAFPQRARRGLLATPWAKLALGAAGVAALGALVAVLLAVFAGRDDGTEQASPGESPTPQPSVTTTATPTPGPAPTPIAQCPAGVPDDVCAFAVEFEAHVRALDLSAILLDSPLDTDQGRSDVTRVLKTLNPQDARLVAIGCPFAAMPLNCEGTFGLAFSSLPPGQNPSELESGIATFAFVRDEQCDYRPWYDTGRLPDCSATPAAAPYLVSATNPADADTRHAVTKGGFIQGGTLAGRPTGITDSEVRSEWAAVTTNPPGTEYVNGVAVQEMTLAPAAEIPFEGVLYIAGGCWACEGNHTSIDRVYQKADGTLLREKLLEGDITGVVVRAGPQKLAAMVGDIYVTRCTQGYCGPLNALTPDSASELLRSKDGGVTWERLATFEGAADVREFGGELVLGRAHGEGDPREWEYRYEQWPSGEAVELPQMPWVVAPDGRIAVMAPDRLRYLYDDGTVFWESPFGALPNADGVYLQNGPDGLLLASFQTGTGPGTGGEGYLAIFSNGQLVRVYSGDIGMGASRSSPSLGNAVLSPAQLGIQVAQGPDFPTPWPATVDYLKGTVEPIEPQFFADAYGVVNRRTVLGLHSGPLTRVTGAGDCLNVRRQPSVSAAVIACYPDGTLLKHTGTTQEAGGRTWQEVIVPAEPYWGWAATEFLAAP
ncbi:MAG: helix-turn-helix transcriptional regulator [Dehalococcoidia bacterium]|nr:helix-turn-helix transcriptional regulator [Dehalococcoidia bacterium]